MVASPQRFHEMSKDEYEASAGEGRRWVYHATSRPEHFAEGVKMANVPQHMQRQRYQKLLAGEDVDVTFAPGAGLGQGTYVSGEHWQATGYGHHMLAISIPHEGHLEVPPEARDYRPDDVNFHLNQDQVGALLTKDVGPEHVHSMGRITHSVFTGHETHQLNAMRRGEHVPEEHVGEKVREHIRRAKENNWDL